MKIELKSRNNAKRKRGRAIINVRPGLGNIYVNNRKFEEYIQYNPKFIYAIRTPLSILEVEQKYDIIIEAKGGGISAQADAIKLGIARAMYNLTSDENKNILKYNSLLTSNSKRKERKKYGLKKARKSPQFSKR